MTVVQVSRSKIIKAIKDEPLKTLQADHWYFFDGRGPDEKKQVRNKNCTVCAVGAVMRNALLAPTQPLPAIAQASQVAVGNYGYGYCSASAIQLNLEEENYMAALSAFFESNAADMGINECEDKKERKALTKKLRDMTVKFVKKSFPKTVYVNIDGAKPAKDIKVVS